MKIAVIHRDLPPQGKGGVSYQVLTLSNALVEAGHSVTVFTLSPKPWDALFDVVTVKPPKMVQGHRMLSYYLLSFVLSRLDYSRYDLVHSHGDTHFPFFPRPLVRTFHGSAISEALHPSSLKRFLSQLSLYPAEWLSGLLADYSVGISKATKTCLPFIRRVIPACVDLTRFVPSSGKSESPSILFVGTLRGRKRGWLLLSHFRKHVLKAIPSCELWMVCNEQLEDRQNVRWLGKVSTARLVELYQKAWVFCMPSSYEGFGVPYVEAMACGTPVVTTPNPGASEVLEDGKYGAIVEAGSLGEALVNLLENPDRRERMTRRGLERATRYSLEKVVKQYEEVYGDLLLKTYRDRPGSASTREGVLVKNPRHRPDFGPG